MIHRARARIRGLHASIPVIATALLAAARALAGPMVLHQGTAAEPPSLDPTIGAGSLAAPVITDLFTGLLVRDAESRPAAGAAESWSVSDDGLSWTFRLRENLRWSDGRALGADDFVYSFRRLMTPATASTLAGVYFYIKGGRAVFRGEAPPETLGVAAPDPRTFVMRLEHPVPYLLQMLANVQVAPVPRHVIEQHGREWTRPGLMVGNGPYVLAERVPQSYIRLVRNPHFFAADTVSIDEIWFHPTQDLGTSLRRFRAGELDIVLNFPPDEIDWIRANIPETLHVVPSLGSYFLTVNTGRKPFDDVRVRRALSLAIDREALTERLLRTGVKPAYSFVPPDFEGYAGGFRDPESAAPLPQRQAQARKLLAAAGFGPDRPLTVPLIYDTQEENRKIMVAVSAMWQAIGVRTEMTNLDFRALTSRIRTMNYDVAKWSYFASFGDAYAFLQLLESTNPNNWPGWKNDKFDALLSQSNHERRPDVRAGLLREAEALLMRELAVIPIYYYVGRRLVSPRVKGWIDTPRGTTPTRYLRVER
jgi:oligopeptide transport system substrate-binding protein